MAENGLGGPKVCPGCGDEVEADWVKCPVCNYFLKETKAPAVPPPPGPPIITEQAPQPAPQIETTPPPSLPSSPIIEMPQTPPETPVTSMDSLRKDLTDAEEVHKISANAAAKSHQESAKKDDSDARIRDLEVQLKDSQAQIQSTEENLAMSRMEREALTKKLSETEATLAALDSEKKALEELVVLREGDLKKREDELKARDDGIVLKETRTNDDRERIKAQAIALTEIETKLEVREKALKEKEEALAKDEASLDQVEASLKDRETGVVHGHEDLKVKRGELDGMIDQYANRLAQVKLREDKVNAIEAKTKDLSDKNEKDKTELGRLRVQLETERADISTRSKGLFERLQKAEVKSKELDDREKVVKDTERKAQKWQEDLRHTEIHLMSIQEEINSCVYCSAKDRFMMVEKLISDAKAVGAETDMAEAEVKSARLLLDAGEFAKAVEKASNAIKLAETSKKQYYSYGVRYTIRAVEKIINSIKELGVSTEEPEGMLKDAKTALTEEDYERAEECAKMAERIALYTEEKAEEISSGIHRLEGMIAKAKAEKRDAGVAEGLLTQAKDLAKKGNYGSSLEYLREAEKSLMEQQVSSVKEGLKEEPAEAQAPPPGPPEPAPEEPIVQEPEQPAVEPQYAPTPPVEQTQTETTYSAGGPIHQTVPQQQYYTPQPQAPPPPQETPGQRFRCPYCQSVFEVRADYRPVQTTCPYCSRTVMIN
jgi:tetratricopeptide (TPR) repeat protein